MHQPLIWTGDKLQGNLQKMLESQDPSEKWNGQLMARAYNNPAKYVSDLKAAGANPRVMLDYSGILLESLAGISKEKGFSEVDVDGGTVGDFAKNFKRAFEDSPGSIEFAGSAYSHCYFPTTPEGDWAYQISEWRNVFKKIFGAKALGKVKGFWLPEMGVPGYEDRLTKLIRVIKDSGYEWIILPLQSAEGYEQMSLDRRIRTACHPHSLSSGSQSIPIIFSMPTYYLDQQSGTSAENVYRQSIQAGKSYGSESKPSLIVPASDGENGNVMMNEFFPSTFSEFFKERADRNISSLCVTDFLHKYHEKRGEIAPDDEIKVKTLGSSWIGSHSLWSEGERREKMIAKIEALSSRFAGLSKLMKGKKVSSEDRKALEDAKRALLLAETSCYVYWGVDFWFDQGDKMISFASQKVESIYKRF